MPVVFSPGEPETRPLDPTATVYTTAQRVADLLDIGPQEAVLMSADGDAGAVYITGTDFRNHGFTVGDKVRIYSDADPFGKEDLEISAIGASTGGDTAGTGHVKITFTTSPITTSEYQVADNGYIQNQASFTNGKTRGVTKAKVDHTILKMQDRIDNVTHNKCYALSCGKVMTIERYAVRRHVSSLMMYLIWQPPVSMFHPVMVALPHLLKALVQDNGVTILMLQLWLKILQIW